jgi:ribosomal protein L37AE/L43A
MDAGHGPGRRKAASGGRHGGNHGRPLVRKVTAVMLVLVYGHVCVPCEDCMSW